MKVSETRICIWMVALMAFSCGESKETRLQRFLIQSNSFIEHHETEQAERYLREAIKLDSCFADAWNNLGTIFFNQRKYAEALEYYDQAIACRPDYLPAYFNRVNTQYELKAYYAALKDIDRILKDRPDTAVAYFSKGLIYSKLREFDKSLEAFRKSLSLDKKNPEILVNIGTLY